MGAKRSCYALPVLFLSFPFRVVLRTARDVLTALLPLRAAAAFKDKGLVVGSGAAASLEEKLFVAAGSAMATFLRCEIASRCAPSLLKPKQKNCAIRCCASSKMRVVSHGVTNHELIVIFPRETSPCYQASTSSFVPPARGRFNLRAISSSFGGIGSHGPYWIRAAADRQQRELRC
jgi:hypothetical protein